MKKLFIQLLIIAIICVQLSCSINREDKIHSFNVLYCKKNPSGY